jgi:hypothetical protein
LVSFAIGEINSDPPPQDGASDGDKDEHQVRDEVNGFRKRFTHKFFFFLEQESFGKRAHRSLLKSFGLLAAGDADTLSGRYMKPKLQTPG